MYMNFYFQFVCDSLFVNLLLHGLCLLVLVHLLLHCCGLAVVVHLQLQWCGLAVEVHLQLQWCQSLDSHYLSKFNITTISNVPITTNYDKIEFKVHSKDHL